MNLHYDNAQKIITLFGGTNNIFVQCFWYSLYFSILYIFIINSGFAYISNKLYFLKKKSDKINLSLCITKDIVDFGNLKSTYQKFLVAKHFKKNFIKKSV